MVGTRRNPRLRLPKGWKLYRTREHSPGYWGLGLTKSRDYFAVELFKWGLSLHKDDPT